MSLRIIYRLIVLAILFGCDSMPEKTSTRRISEGQGSNQSKDASADKQAPSEQNDKNSKFQHDFKIESCGKCHEGLRPKSPHPQKEDCISCHSFEKSWKDTKAFSHVPKPNSCNHCHLEKRPLLPHPQGGDCVDCHKYPSFKNVNTFDHNPPPGSCEGCHKEDRPLANHVTNGDCVECHQYPKWDQSTKFTHTPTPDSCITCHQGDRPALPHVQNIDCVECHRYPGWDQVSFDHDPKPQTCEECHTRPSDTYRRAYPNVGPPQNFNANNPNELGSGHMVGLDCNVCHLSPKEGAQEFRFNHDNPVVPYCLPCHYNEGVREHGVNGRAQLSGFGNCYNCHKSFRASRGRSFDD